MASKGRKKINPETKEKALEAIKSGKPLKEVAEDFKVSYATINNWKNAGKKGKKSKGKPSKASPNDEVALLKLELDYLRAKLKYYEGK